jgi:hypothetical protein
MREKMDQMQREFNRFLEMLRDYAAQNAEFQKGPHAYEALVPMRRAVDSHSKRSEHNNETNQYRER